MHACACNRALALRLLHASPGGRVRGRTLARCTDLSASKELHDLDRFILGRCDSFQPDHTNPFAAWGVVNFKLVGSGLICWTLFRQAFRLGRTGRLTA